MTLSELESGLIALIQPTVLSMDPDGVKDNAFNDGLISKLVCSF